MFFINLIDNKILNDTDLVFMNDEIHVIHFLCLTLIIHITLNNVLYNFELEDSSELEGILSWYVENLMDIL